MTTFEEYEKRGLVRIRFEPSPDVYDDSYIEDGEDVEHDESTETGGTHEIAWSTPDGRVRTEWWSWSATCGCKGCLKARLWRQIQFDGVWDMFIDYRASTAHKWEGRHFCGDFIGTGENGYEGDAKAEAVEALEELFQEQADELAGRATFAAG